MSTFCLEYIFECIFSISLSFSRTLDATPFHISNNVFTFATYIVEKRVAKHNFLVSSYINDNIATNENLDPKLHCRNLNKWENEWHLYPLPTKKKKRKQKNEFSIRFNLFEDNEFITHKHNEPYMYE